VFFANPHKKKSHGVKSGDRGGHSINASSSCPVHIPKHKMTAHVFRTPYLLLLSPSGKSGQQCARAFPYKTSTVSLSIDVRITMILCVVYLLRIF